MLLTLSNRSLADFTVKYEFFENKLTLIVETDNPHKIYGKTKITLTNCQDKNIYTDYETVVEDFFNDTHEVEAVSTTRLEKTIVCYRGFPHSAEEIEVQNNGSSITAAITNSSVYLEPGKYNFLLLDSEDTEFSTSKISIEQTNIANTGLSGIGALFNESGAGDYPSINNSDLTFTNKVLISLHEDDEGVTNIPLFITKL